MFPLYTNRSSQRLASSPARPHRMLRTGSAAVELAAGVAGAGFAVAVGAPAGPALLAGLGAVVVLGVATTLAGGGTPARVALGYRVVGQDGGRPPWWGVVLRELARPAVVVATVDTAGFVGAMLGPRTERWGRRVTGSVVVGRPRRAGAAGVAVVGAVLAVAYGAGAAAVWGGALWAEAFLGWAAVASAFGAALVALAREEVRWLDLTGELVATEDATAEDIEDLPTTWDPALPDRGAEVRHRPTDAGPGHPDVLVSPRGAVATTKRRR